MVVVCLKGDRHPAIRQLKCAIPVSVTSQVVYFRNPSERTSTKEHLIRNCNKHKIQLHIPKETATKRKTKSYAFPKQQKQEKPEKNH